MDGLVERLIKCGYSKSKAEEICISYLRNLTPIDLLFFVMTVEESKDVD